MGVRDFVGVSELRLLSLSWVLETKLETHTLRCILRS